MLVTVRYLKSFLPWIIHWILIVGALCLFASEAMGQEERKKRLLVLPVIFSSPETSLGFGVAGLHYFRTDTLPLTKPSSIRSVIIYTLENQLLVQVPIALFLENNKYWINARLNYFSYPFQYFGIGNQIDLDLFDNYEANYLRFEFDALRKVGNATYIGPKVKFTHYFDIQSITDRGILTDNVLGFETGSISGMGIGMIHDQRNNLFCPNGGYYIEMNVMQYAEFLGGEYNFTDIEFDLRKYYAFGKSELGFQFYQNSLLGSVPFYNLAQMGGSSRMRGYFRGAYRDKHFTTIQSEYRYHLLKRFVLSGFTGIGSVSSNFISNHKWLPSGGMGIRFVIDQKERIRIRADYAFGKQSSGFYLNINEAF